MALETAFPGFKRRGLLKSLEGTKYDGVVIFVSEHASFSYDKFSVWQGKSWVRDLKIKVNVKAACDIFNAVIIDD